jgi:hypothetical protein
VIAAASSDNRTALGGRCGGAVLRAGSRSIGVSALRDTTLT